MEVVVVKRGLVRVGLGAGGYINNTVGVAGWVLGEGGIKA